MPKLLISPFDTAKLQPAHGRSILAHAGLPAHPQVPFGSAWACLKPGMEQEPLVQEDTAKIYVVVQGRLQIVADGEPYEVKAGEAVLIPAGTHHSVRSVGEEDAIDFAFWWQADRTRG